MTDLAVPHFLPGQPAPRSSAYHEVDPWTWKIVRRLLVAQGEQFPTPKREGGFYTSSKTQLEPRRAVHTA